MPAHLLTFGLLRNSFCASSDWNTQVSCGRLLMSPTNAQVLYPFLHDCTCSSVSSLRCCCSWLTTFDGRSTQPGLVSAAIVHDSQQQLLVSMQCNHVRTIVYAKYSTMDKLTLCDIHIEWIESDEDALVEHHRAGAICCAQSRIGSVAIDCVPAGQVLRVRVDRRVKRDACSKPGIVLKYSNCTKILMFIENRKPVPHLFLFQR